MSDKCRQHYELATGKGIAKEASGPPTTPRYAKGGTVRKNAGGAMYSKGGSAKGGKR